MGKVDYIIIGAQRCGTTSLMHYIADHPAVGGVPRHEVDFFTWNYHKGWGWYDKRLGPGPFRGEKSPSYLAHLFVPQRMVDCGMEAKFIVLLRNPIDRALSHHRLRKHFFGDGRTFDQAIWAFRAKNEDDFGFSINNLLYRGHYAEQLKRWFALFPRDRFCIIRSEDFFSHTATQMGIVWDFLGLERIDMEYKVLGTVKARATMSAETRERLQEYYAPLNAELEKLLGRSFGWK